MTSFQKRKQIMLPPGTRISIQSKQPITSCGIPSLDRIIGGGLPIGSVTMIEEDKFATYSKVMAKYFLAEGIYSQHKTLLASLDDDPHDLYKKLPSPCEDIEGPNQTGDDMKIAWRYNNLPQVEPLELQRTIGHNFDLTKPIAKTVLDGHDTQSWTGTDTRLESSTIFKNPRFTTLLQRIVAVAKLARQEQEQPSNECCRICVTSLGSPQWYGNGFESDLVKFLSVLKATMRSTFAVCFVTVPMHLLQLLNETLPSRIRNLVDYSIHLEAFAGSDKETNPIFKEYHGLLNIRKMAALNTLNVFTPETTDLAFKLRRKKFVIEKLHLPPELQENDPQQDVPTASCSDPQKHRLEF